MNKQLLANCGIDYDSGVEKFLGESELYESLLINFLDDNTFDQAKQCADHNDVDGVLKNIHAMKSVTGTLCMNRLYQKCCETVAYVRSGEYSLMKERFKETYDMYTQISQAIKSA
jgi:hypothetical protein